MNRLMLIVLSVSFCMVLGACTSSMSSNTYSRSQAGKVQTVHEGEVVMVREVQIEGSKSGLGAVAGGFMGYAIGKNVGGGSGRDLARTAGTIGGAMAGAAAEEAATRQTGLEITVKLDNGEVISIVQGADVIFDEGDSVKVIRRPDGSARVIQ